MRWTSFAIRGIAAIVLGVIALLQPGIALGALILVFGAYAIVDGAFAIVAGWRAPGSTNWYLIVLGVLGLIVGVFAFISPGLTALALLTLIGIWAVITGVAEIVAAWRLRQVIENELMLGLSGLISVIFGAYVLLFPGSGALAVIWLIGIYAIVAGLLLLAVAWRLRSHEGSASAGNRMFAR
jgi:uncharacterized membrane protein HdeD (DUF308 family)